MNINTKLNLILKGQEDNLTIEEIADKLDMTPKAIRSFMGRQNYKCKNGVFLKKEDANDNNSYEQLSLTDDIIKPTEVVLKHKTPKKQVEENPKDVLCFVAKPSKKQGKLEVTPEFLDMVHELRDFYLEVKDLPQLKHKVTKKNKNVVLDENLIEEPLSKKIQTDKESWEKLVRLSENSEVEVNDLVTQAIKNILKEYKHLI